MIRRVLWGLAAIFYGVALHDFAHQVWELKGYHNLVEGGYVGFIGLAACIILLQFKFRGERKRPVVKTSEAS